jgi:hypothetical protein
LDNAWVPIFRHEVHSKLSFKSPTDNVQGFIYFVLGKKVTTAMKKWMKPVKPSGMCEFKRFNDGMQDPRRLESTLSNGSVRITDCLPDAVTCSTHPVRDCAATKAKEVFKSPEAEISYLWTSCLCIDSVPIFPMATCFIPLATASV